MNGVNYLKYKLIAIDLDDTLLAADLSISPINRQAIACAVSKGVKVTISTGRMFRSTLPYVEQLKLDVPVITYQGALIKNAISKEVVLARSLPLDISLEIIEESRKHGVYVQIYIADDYFFDKRNGYNQMYYDLSGIEGKAVKRLEDFLVEEPLKILIMDSPETISYLTGHYADKFKGKAEITVSKSNYLEFTNIEASKGSALDYLSQLLGIKRDEVIAIGDGYNDISMIKYAGLGVAMSNAPDDVKKHADFITCSNEDNGVAYVINKFVLEEE
ncbi:MAG: Sugar phosphatase YidA [candidate division WS2 bacterium]|nr:Sugar phosphatase YidA [Candidatus Psychracetigena formicireducens]